MIRVGESAWLLELASNAQVLAARRMVDAELAPQLRELVPGASTLLVIGDLERPLDPRRLDGIERAARQVHEGAAVAPARLHRIPVRYDGADLDELAARAQLRRDQLIAYHAAPEYRVAFVGFQPGFAYLD